MDYTHTCKYCGRPFTNHGPRGNCCPACLPRRKAEELQKAAERARRNRNRVPARKLGSAQTCERCGKPYSLQNAAQRFCPECGPIHRAEQQAQIAARFYEEQREARHAAYATRKYGPDAPAHPPRTKRCADCGALLPSRRYTYCADCARARRRAYNTAYVARKRAQEKEETP